MAWATNHAVVLYSIRTAHRTTWRFPRYDQQRTGYPLGVSLTRRHLIIKVPQPYVADVPTPVKLYDTTLPRTRR